MTNRDMPDMFDGDPPVLICADLQCEYLAQGRRHRIANADAVMPRCLELMTLWRDNLLPVIHLKRIAQAAWFNPASNLTNWIAELKPLPAELTFEHPLPSAYSSARFAEYMSNMRNIRCLVLGFSLDETILSTVIDGFHRSHRYQVVGDAVACRRPGIDDVASYKAAVTKVLGNFAGVVGSADLSGQAVGLRYEGIGQRNVHRAVNSKAVTSKAVTRKAITSKVAPRARSGLGGRRDQRSC